jgi:plastocyanin
MLYTRLVSFALAVAILGCGGGGGDTTPTTPTPPVTPGGPTATTAVTMQSNTFNPAAIQVSPGATVTWTNSDGYAHNVTFSDATITGSGNFSTGTRSIVMPAAAATYNYSCTIHPGMTGTVKVQ